MSRQQIDKRTALLAGAGIAGPIGFTLAFIVQALFRPAYEHLADPVSALAAGPSGWVQDVNFVVFGLLMSGYAIGLHLGVRPAHWGTLGTGLLVLSGLGLVLAGLFPARDASGAFSNQPGHVLAAFLSFLGAGTGLIMMWRRMAGDPRWRDLARYALASGIAVVVLFLMTGALAIPPDAPLHPWLGLLQRVTLAVWFPATVVLAVRLLHVARAADTPPTATPTRTTSTPTTTTRRQ